MKVIYFQMVTYAFAMTSCFQEKAPTPPGSSLSSESGNSGNSAEATASSQQSGATKSYKYGAKVGNNTQKSLVNECVESKSGFFDRVKNECNSKAALLNAQKKPILCNSWSELENVEAIGPEIIAKIKKSLNNSDYLPDQCKDFGNYFYIHFTYQKSESSDIQIKKFCINNDSGCP